MGDKGLGCLLLITKVASSCNGPLDKKLTKATDGKSAVTISRVDDPQMAAHRKADILRV